MKKWWPDQHCGTRKPKESAAAKIAERFPVGKQLASARKFWRITNVEKDKNQVISSILANTKNSCGTFLFLSKNNICNDIEAEIEKKIRTCSKWVKTKNIEARKKSKRFFLKKGVYSILHNFEFLWPLTTNSTCDKGPLLRLQWWCFRTNDDHILDVDREWKAHANASSVT